MGDVHVGLQGLEMAIDAERRVSVSDFLHRVRNGFELFGFVGDVDWFRLYLRCFSPAECRSDGWKGS